LREERKFSSKAQVAAKEQKQKNKRQFAEAVKQHRKGMKDQLETMLNNASHMQDMDDEEPRSSNSTRKRPSSKMSRNARDQKYGYGGQKKRSKRNDKER
jgi:rRNA-processing protein EBP2